MKDFFSSLKTRLLGGGGQQTFNSENKLYREEELLNNCNFDSLNKNDLQGGDLYLSTVTSAENHIGGGKLRFVNGSCATLCSNEGGEGNYASLMSSDFADTKTMLNPDHRVGGEIHLDSSSKKGGKPFNRLASYTRNDFSFKKGGAGLIVCTPFHYEGGVC